MNQIIKNNKLSHTSVTTKSLKQKIVKNIQEKSFCYEKKSNYQAMDMSKYTANTNMLKR